MPLKSRIFVSLGPLKFSQQYLFRGKNICLGSGCYQILSASMFEVEQFFFDIDLQELSKLYAKERQTEGLFQLLLYYRFFG